MVIGGKVMGIFKAIECSNNPVNYKEIDYNQHLLPLTYREYEFIYKELRFSNTFHFVDESDNLNFVMKVDFRFNIESIIKNRKFLYVTRDIDGPIIELTVENINMKYKFRFSLDDKRQIYNLRKLLELKRSYFHFLIESNNQYIKSNSFTLEFDTNMIEKLKYMISYSYYGSCPSKEFKLNSEHQANFLGFSYDEKILEELLEITDKLQKWGSKDTFAICLENEDYLIVNFSGTINNFRYFKNELIKKFKLVSEGKKELTGKPFLMFDNGLSYFFDNNNT
jgi:hypothetical protein